MEILNILALVSAAGLVAVWIAYPAAIGALSLLRRGHRVGAAATPTVSVVVVTREPDTAVRARVADLLRTDYDRNRLEIVVALEPGRVLPDLAGESDPVVVVPADATGGKVAGLNAALRVAGGDVIVFADTYQHYEAGTIAALVAPFADPRIGAVTGGYRLAPGSGALISAYWSFERWLRRAEARLHSSVGATGAVYAMRRHLWKPLPPGLILDDVFNPMRVVLSGSRVAVSDGAVAIETRTPTPAQEYGRKVRTLTGVLQLCAWMPEVLVPFRNPIWLQFVFHKLLRLMTPYFCGILLLWALVTAAIAFGPVPFAVGAAATVLLGMWAARSRSGPGSKLRRLVSEGVLLQFAALVAGFNGLRGQWQVWDA